MNEGALFILNSTKNLFFLYQFNSLELLITDDKPFGTIRFFCISCDFLTPKTGRALFNVMQKEFLK